MRIHSFPFFSAGDVPVSIIVIVWNGYTYEIYKPIYLFNICCTMKQCDAYYHFAVLSEKAGGLLLSLPQIYK